MKWIFFHVAPPSDVANTLSPAVPAYRAPLYIARLSTLRVKSAVPKGIHDTPSSYDAYTPAPPYVPANNPLPDAIRTFTAAPSGPPVCDHSARAHCGPINTIASTTAKRRA